MRRLFSPKSSSSRPPPIRTGRSRAGPGTTVLTPPAPPLTPISSYHNRIRQFSLVMELQKVAEALPPGMYVVPDLGNFRLWHGVVFVRAGPYRPGVFKFVVQFPDRFPETPPIVRFTSKMFHPLIDPDDGHLDPGRYHSEWQPNDHVADLLSYLKSIFFDTTLWRAALNPDAYALWEQGAVGFEQGVQDCVRLSLDRVYVNDDGCSIAFSRSIPEHQRLMERIRNQDPIQAWAEL